MLSFTMSLAGVIPFLSAWTTAFGMAAEQPVVSRMVVRDEIVIHVPIGRRPPPMIEWVERKGPKCLSASMIAGAALAGPSEIDFVLRDRRRVRAELDSDCAGLDFYDGFYVEPRDGAVCARREEIRVRAGSTCRIDRFHSLVPTLKR